MGSPLRGRGLFVLDRNEGLVSPFGSGTMVSSWLDLPPLSAGICASCPSGCVARWSSLCPYPSVILSSLQGSSLSLVRVQCCLPDPCSGSGVVFRTQPSFLPAGVGASVGGSALRPTAAGVLFPGVPLWGCGFWGILGSLHCAPLTVGLPPGSPTLLCLLSAGCSLGLENSPSGEASASSCRFSWRPGAAGALAVTLHVAASQREFFPLCLVLPLLEICHFFSRLFLCWRPCRSRSLIPSLAPSGGLVRFCGGLCWSSLDMSWACPPPFLCVGLVVRSRCIVAPLAPCLSWRFPSLVRVSLLRRGVSPYVWSRRGPWGVAVAPPIPPYTRPGWSLPFCRVPLELRSVFYVLLCDIPPVFMAIIWSVSLTPACPLRVTPIRVCSLDTCVACDWLDFLSSS